MHPADLGLLVLAAATWLIVWLLRTLARIWHHDEAFTGVTPGIIPPNPAQAPRARLKGLAQEYDGEIAVAFAPPAGLRPGLVGTVVDGVVDSHDLTASLVDLAVRGHLVIVPVPGGRPLSSARRHLGRRGESADPPRTDWILRRADRSGADQLDPSEKALLEGILNGHDEVWMSQLDEPALKALRQAQQDLYAEVVNRGWYRTHPRQRGGWGCLIIGLGVVAALAFVLGRTTWPGVLAGVSLIGAAIWLSRGVRGRTPRTAEGSAVRIQALGFRRYLATAEAEQFSFEEAAGIFSRYLPWAMVFGVAQHWAKVFGDLASRAQDEGIVIGFDLFWFDPAAWDALGGAGDLLAAGVGGDLPDLGNLFGDGSGELFDGLGASLDGLEGFATGIGEFFGSLDFLDGLGDGCGCIDF